MVETAIFFLLSAVPLGCAALVVSLRNVFHAALFLIGALAGVAGLDAFLAADFLFAVQLLVYAGGVTVLLLFVIFLSGRKEDWRQSPLNERVWGGALFSGLFVAMVGAIILRWPAALAAAPPPSNTTGRIGDRLLSDLLLPFEVISLVLVAALVGAVYFTARRDP